MQGNDLDQVIAQIQARFPLRSRRECEETLEVVNNDVNKALAFLEYLGPRVPSNQTQDARVTSISQRRNSAQDVAGGDVRAGQKGVLKLSTTEWTPGEGFATGQRSMSVISAAPGPSGPTGPQNQMPSGSATTSKHKAYSICKYSHVSIMIKPFANRANGCCRGSVFTLKKGT